jgi:DNA repair protein RadD
MARTPLRPIQRGLKSAIIAAWLVSTNVLAVAPTGAGKTVLFSDIVADERGAVCVIAHRSELVAQMSLSLAKMGIRHRIIGGKDLTAECSASHVEELGVSYISAHAGVVCASVDTLIGKRCQQEQKAWFPTVKLWVMDEAHHVLVHNKWGEAVALFPNARGLGVTATPERADGYGLGATSDGVFHQMVLAPGMREHIDRGYLTDYRVFCPPCDIDLTKVPTTASGEFSPKPLAIATRNSHITRDVVKEYLRISPGKLGITFAVDVAAAADIAQAFRDKGISSEVVTAKTPANIRRHILRKFRAREILMLVNVDLFGEGFDLPAVEVVIMARATQSLNLFIQQFGRNSRLMIDPATLKGWDSYSDAERRYFISISGKPHGIVIDLVGNTLRHGLPDKFRAWSLGKPIRRNKKPKDEYLIEMTACPSCTIPYELIYRACPHCGVAPVIADRTRVEFVQGDCNEIAPEVLAIMRGAIETFDKPPRTYGFDSFVSAGMLNRHAERCAAQDELRNTIALWAGYHRDQGRDDSQIYRLFYLTYGVDMMSAQVLVRKDAEPLTARLQARLDELGVFAESQSCGY